MATMEGALDKPFRFEGRRLRGILQPVKKAGYGFLELGPGYPPCFILRRQLEPRDWVSGTEVEFDALPPRKGTSALRCENVAVIRDAKKEDPHAADLP
ncbi:MAG TPA: hypothetical protein VFV77_01670 [Gammaproteobacteria bacterium]|nr:hypothetical protein [Gammaproteobacteria bacterium]